MIFTSFRKFNANFAKHKHCLFFAVFKKIAKKACFLRPTISFHRHKISSFFKRFVVKKK